MINVLLVEADSARAGAIQSCLHEAGAEELLVDTVEHAEDVLQRGDNSVDVVLARAPPASPSDLTVLDELRRLGVDAPVILLTETDDDQLASEAFRRGAQECFVLGEADARQLARAIRHARERKRAGSAAPRAGGQDLLTSLPDRALYYDRLEHAIARARRTGERVAVLFVDIDHFKRVNDSLGHAAGDELLRRISRRLVPSLRKGDTLARLGGDEFIVLLEDVGGQHTAAAVARKLLHLLRKPFRLASHKTYVTASIGIAVHPECALEAEELTKLADRAMYKAKRQGRDCYRFYTRKMSAAELATNRVEAQLREALDHGELTLVYQPRIDIRSRGTVAVEALLRWKSPSLGRVPPARFIPVAEETGLIYPIGEWALDNVCAQSKDLERLGSPGLRIAVNVSSHQLKHTDFAQLVHRALARWQLAPQALEIEITERHLSEDERRYRLVLGELRDMGIAISIDDFGTGTSPLSYLKGFPVDTLKIDQSFVHDVPHDAGDGAIVRAVISLSRDLGFQAVAEGVESARQLRFLRRLGCEQAQGFYLAAPLPAAQLTRWLTEQTSTKRPTSTAPV